MTSLANITNIKKNDILVHSFGYDETLVDFYKVISVGPRSVKAIKIGKQFVGQMEVVPVDAPANNEAQTFRCDRRGVLGISYFRGRRHSLFKYDGRPEYCSI